ncbi:MAG: XRE family transcriptional regulator [Clostridia bacterium]|nr:XRE family transcriptional regulator [Clostridia bacterium]
MDVEKIGKAIKELRQKAGYTQAELAQCLEVTDKAISRWERCLGIPDTSLLAKLCDLLNADIDNLLEGNIAYLEHSWKGVLILKENEAEIMPDTRFGGKCSVYFPISYFLLAGIKNITVVGSEKYINSAKNILSDGKNYGVDISYSLDESEAFNNNEPCMVVSSDVFIYGSNLTRCFQRAIAGNGDVTYIVIPQSKCSNMVYFDNSHIVKNYCHMSEKFERIPITFYKNANMYLKNNGKKTNPIVMAQRLSRGMIYRKIETWKDVNDVSNFIYFTEENTGDYMYCLEEIALNRGLISKSQLQSLADENTKYGKYLLSL